MSEQRTAASSEGPRVVDVVSSRLPDEVIEAMFLLGAAAVGFILTLVVVTCVVTVRTRRTVASHCSRGVSPCATLQRRTVGSGKTLRRVKP